MPDPVLLLSSDEQAVQVVSQVLAELGFAVERAANTPAAVSLIEKRALGVIVVDCDDSVSGKVVFERARRSDLNKLAPAIAIVSGRSGLPTAFRLGAGFVITKPASLDQTRHALRAATSRIKRDPSSPVQNSTSAIAVTLSARAAAASASTSTVPIPVSTKDLEPKTIADPTPKAELSSTTAVSTRTASPSGTAAAAAPGRGRWPARAAQLRPRVN